ncbi:hypothetical protein E8E11_001413 [Didymella keratinophila]|nr:hypothetical protein E8E11_001413 [Didymella keratinophila]
MSAPLWKVPEAMKFKVHVNKACWRRVADAPFRKTEKVYLDVEQPRVAEEHVKEDVFFFMVTRNCGLILGSEARRVGGVGGTIKDSLSDTHNKGSDSPDRQYRRIDIVRLRFASRDHSIKAPVGDVCIV